MHQEHDEFHVFRDKKLTIRKPVYHPILFGLFAVLVFHNHISPKIIPFDLAVHLILVVAATTILTEILGLIMRSVTRAAFIITMTLVLSILYMSVITLFPGYYLVLEESKIGTALLVLPVCGCLLYITVIRTIEIRGDMKALSGILAWVGVVLVAVQLGYGGYRLIDYEGESACLDLPGDANNDGNVNVADVVFLVSYVFRNGPAPPCLEEGNCNGDDAVNVGDAVWLERYIFKGGPAPKPSPPMGKT